MKISAIEIRACSHDNIDDATAGQRAALPGGTRPPFLVVTLRTDDGASGTSFGFGTLDPRAAAHALLPVKNFFLGRDPVRRELAWHEFSRFNRNWTHAPLYAYGPFDNACWDILGQVAGLPVHRVLGGARDRVPTYVSSMFLPHGIQAYVDEAVAAKMAGFHGYKIHPPGDAMADVEVYEAVRDAVGPGFALMADPVGAYTYDEALRIGRVLERLGYLWLEEPVWDNDWFSQAKLAQQLDIPIVGTETLPDAHRGTSQLIVNRAVDMVRADVSWRGGITGVIKTAALADAFGMRCELHTCVYHALDLVNLHVAAATTTSRYFELLFPLEDNNFGLLEGIQIDDGYAVPPDRPGLGILYDWDYIDNHTVALL